MADDKPLKSALDLAMERLRQSDKDAGVESRPLTDAQKAAIAEVRNFYEAKLAEQQVLHQSTLRNTPDPAERAALDAELSPGPASVALGRSRTPRSPSSAARMDDTFLVTCPYCGEGGRDSSRAGRQGATSSTGLGAGLLQPVARACVTRERRSAPRGRPRRWVRLAWRLEARGWRLEARARR